MPAMTSAAAALHSDHVNLLIFRYLQEVGFETAAKAFHLDWHRPPDCHDPEDLPFAQEVQRNELVSVIQTGLYHDDLQSRLSKGERRFRWMGIDARDSVEKRDAAVENGTGSRPSSSYKRKERPSSAMRPPGDFRTPAPKRQRRSEGSEAHVNGDRDAMDIDAASASADADDEPDAISPTVQSEPDQVEIMERYDSMDVATQTEMKTAPKTSTMYWRVEKPTASVMHSMWNPALNSTHAKSLLTVGGSLCRFYLIPDSLEDARQITHIDEPTLPEGSTVTASAWRPDGLGASCAIVSIDDLPDNSKTDTQQLLEINREAGTVILRLGPTLLEPTGIVLHLRYSPDAQYLLAARLNDARGLVQIWKLPRPGSEGPKKHVEPIAWRVFESQVLDIAWIADDTFLVCGRNGLSAMYQVDGSQERAVATIAAGTVPMRGLISHNSSILPSNCGWDKLRFDQRHNIAVFGSVHARKLVVTPRIYVDTNKSEEDVEVDLPETLNALAFKPWEKPGNELEVAADYETPSLLAAAFADGSCIIYSISRSDAGVRCTEIASLSLLELPALALSWSPNGDHLAVGNGELVQIWTADSFKRKNGVLPTAEASVIWRPASGTNGDSNGDTNGEYDIPNSEMTEPSLSWSADGESLAFAADKQIAIIRFRPPLNGDTHDSEVNGGPSP